MKKLTTTIIGLSLLVGSALSAQDNFTSFYPAEENDTPSYLLTKHNNVMGHQTLATSSIKDSTLYSFYPAEDNDTPDYLVENTKDFSAVSHAVSKSTIQHCTLSAFYPEENIDTRIQSSC